MKSFIIFSALLRKRPKTGNEIVLSVEKKTGLFVECDDIFLIRI